VDIDLDRYQRIYREFGIPTVVDAAASLGTLPSGSENFGSGFKQALVYSMHATKTFSTGEGGVIFSEDPEIICRVRSMGNFGFEEPRTASLPGLNSKLTEVGALIALQRLTGFEDIIQRRSALARVYLSSLRHCSFQEHSCETLAYQFFPILLAESCAGYRDALIAKLKEQGIGGAKYFSPHLAQQSYFRANALAGDLATTDDVSSRVVSQPLYEQMDESDVLYVAGSVNEAIAEMSSASAGAHT
jgi:dTDP-4-amino-4,6-dideoxygalactose transaminase